jgi:hypothetical protein
MHFWSRYFFGRREILQPDQAQEYMHLSLRQQNREQSQGASHHRTSQFRQNISIAI